MWISAICKEGSTAYNEAYVPRARFTQDDVTEESYGEGLDFELSPGSAICSVDAFLYGENGVACSTFYLAKEPKNFIEGKTMVLARSAGSGITASVPNYTTGTFTVDPSVLKSDPPYYFVLEEDSTCGAAPFGEAVVIEFSIEKDEGEEPEPVHTHTEEIIKGTPATCTKTGLTDGKKCSVCGEVLEAQTEIPALGHAYKDGKCTRCGTEDPDYKPVEPDRPEQHYDGVVKGPDGKWGYYVDDVLQTNYTGIKKNDFGWWRIEKGLVNFNATGVYKNEYGWWRVEDGKVNFDAQGIYKNEYGWWKTTDGKVTFKVTGVFKNEYGWWRVEDSKVNFKANGIYKNNYGWWKTTNGKVTFKETGIFKNEYGTWYVQKSKVDFSKNGKVTYNGTTYQVTNGKAKAL